MTSKTAVVVDAVVETPRTKTASFALDAVITVVIDDNPYEDGSVIADEYDLLRDGMTVGAAMVKGVSRRTLWWSANKGYIAVR